MHGACRQFFEAGEACVEPGDGDGDRDGGTQGEEGMLARPVGWRDPVNRAGVVQVSRESANGFFVAIFSRVFWPSYYVVKFIMWVCALFDRRWLARFVVHMLVVAILFFFVASLRSAVAGSRSDALYCLLTTERVFCCCYSQ